MVDKIDQLQINGTSYDIDLPVDAEPNIASLTTSNYITATGNITGNSFIKSGGTSSQFLKADGSIDSTSYLSSHQSIKTLDTTATTAQSTSSNETIAGSGSIILHKVAKTGSYSDLLNIPIIPTITLNGSTTTAPSFYAPISDGSSGQVLTTDGSGTLSWITPSNINTWRSIAVDGTTILNDTSTSLNFLNSGNVTFTYNNGLYADANVDASDVSFTGTSGNITQDDTDVQDAIDTLDDYVKNLAGGTVSAFNSYQNETNVDENTGFILGQLTGTAVNGTSVVMPYPVYYGSINSGTGTTSSPYLTSITIPALTSTNTRTITTTSSNSTSFYIGSGNIESSVTVTIPHGTSDSFTKNSTDWTVSGATGSVQITETIGSASSTYKFDFTGTLTSGIFQLVGYVNYSYVKTTSTGTTITPFIGLHVILRNLTGSVINRTTTSYIRLLATSSYKQIRIDQATPSTGNGKLYIAPNQCIELVYDGTYWELVNDSIKSSFSAITAMPAQQVNSSTYSRSLRINNNVLICYGYVKSSTASGTTISFDTTNGSFSVIPFVQTTCATSADSQTQRCYASSITTSGFTLSQMTSSTTLGVAYIAIGVAA